jgi:pilus assembly protein CpaC
MAVVTGGVLAVIAAVRVTTAQDATATTEAATTQPMFGEVATTEATTQPLVDATPTTQPDSQMLLSDAAMSNATTQPSSTSETASGNSTGSSVITIQYNPANASPTTAPAYTPSSVLPGDATPGAESNAPAHVSADAGDQPKASGSGLVSSGTDQQGRISIAVNKSAVVTTRFPYKRISIGQPDIAEVNAIGAGSVLVTGKKAGTTQLILWDDAEHSQVIDVDVVFDMRALSDLLKSMFPDYAIEAKSLNGAVALRGRVPNAQAADQVIAAATPFGQKVLNFLEIGGGQQVQLQVRIAEVSRTASSELGVNLGYTDGVGFVGSNIGGVNPFGIAVAKPDYFTEADPSTGATTLFGRLAVGNTAVDVFVDALRQNNLARILAEPTLIAISGQAASFLAGGEYPIPVPQGSSGGVTTTIEYRDYGVRLNFVPIVLGDGRIRLKVAPEVSELDYAHAVNLNGYSVPGLTTRKVETCVELAEGQTFAIAGLLSNMQTSSKSVTPLLGDLPVRYERQETELVILVTPRIIAGMNPDKVPAIPGEHWHDPSEVDLYWNRDIGGDTSATTQPADDHKPAPRFHGHYGYMPANAPQSASAE